MVRFTVLASGSRGNSAVVTCVAATGGTTRILVDAGLSCRELFRRMRLAGEDPSGLDAILITHEHQDHVNGLAATARKLGIPVYFTEATHRAWVRQVTPQRRISYAEWAAQYRAGKDKSGMDRTCIAGQESAGNAAPYPEPSPYPEPEPDPSPEPDPVPVPEPGIPSAAAELAPSQLPSVRYFRAGERFSIGDVEVSPFTIPHDAADPVGFVFAAEGLRLAVATDLGYLPPNVKAQLKRCDLIMLESNHDLEMLRDGPYPWSVKQRVLSRVGHLSNDAAASFLEETYDGTATYLILAHLSESNNLPELARLAAERALTCRPALLGNRLRLATQHEPLEPICF